jgi:hypothetical protein
MKCRAFCNCLNVVIGVMAVAGAACGGNQDAALAPAAPTSSAAPANSECMRLASEKLPGIVQADIAPMCICIESGESSSHAATKTAGAESSELDGVVANCMAKLSPESVRAILIKKIEVKAPTLIPIMACYLDYESREKPITWDRLPELQSTVHMQEIMQNQCAESFPTARVREKLLEGCAKSRKKHEGEAMDIDCECVTDITMKYISKRDLLNEHRINEQMAAHREEFAKCGRKR